MAEGSFNQLDSFDKMVSLLPDLYYAVNRVLEDCTGPDLKKKAGVVLWLIGNSRETDQIGPFLLHKQIVERVAEWFVLGTKNARSEAAKAKKQLMDGGYISIAGGNSHVHLTAAGHERVELMRKTARRTVEETLGSLSQAERTLFVDVVQKLLMTKKPPVSEANPLSLMTGTKDSTDSGQR